MSIRTTCFAFRKYALAFAFVIAACNAPGSRRARPDTNGGSGGEVEGGTTGSGGKGGSVGSKTGGTGGTAPGGVGGSKTGGAGGTATGGTASGGTAGTATGGMGGTATGGMGGTATGGMGGTATGGTGTGGTATGGTGGTMVQLPVDLTPVEDTYVRDGDTDPRIFSDVNFGAIDPLNVKTVNVESGWTRRSFLKFNVPKMKVSAAKLKLLVWLSNSNEPVRLIANSVDNNSWGENTMTWNNQPPLGNALTDTTIPTTALTDARIAVELDVTAYVRAAAENGGLLTIGLSADVTQSALCQITSRESATPPVLRLTP